MRKRTAPYTPDPSSQVYPCGRTTVRLLGGDGLSYTAFHDRLEAALPESQMRVMEAHNGTLACYAYALWDDPEIEWTATFDPDEVLLAQGDDLVEIAERLRIELFGPGAKRCGIDLMRLGSAVIPRAVWGLPPEGEDEPRPILEH